jgi:hypothetical protein
MSALFTIVHLTLHEAARRRVLLATLIGAAAFLLLYSIGFHFVALKVTGDTSLTVVRQRMLLNFLTLAGLYGTHFLTLMTAVLLPVDTLSGEIASGVVQTVARCAPPAMDNDTNTTASSAMSGSPTASPGGVKCPIKRATMSTPPATRAE